MTAGFMIPQQDAMEYFLSVADLKNQITREKFHEYISSMLFKKWYCVDYGREHK